MKITQTNNQLEVKKGVIRAVIVGTVSIVLGIVVIIATLSGNFPIHNSQTGETLPPWAGSLVGALFALVGLIFIFFAKSKHIILQLQGQTTVIEKRLLGAPQQMVIPTANIVAVQLVSHMEYDTTTNSSAGNSTTTQSRASSLILLLNNNDQIVVDVSKKNINRLSIGGTGLSSFQKAPLGKEAEQIANFLGVPLKSNDAGSVFDMANMFADILNTTKQPQTPPQSPAQPPTPTTTPPAIPGIPPLPPTSQPPAQPPNNNTLVE